MAKHKEGEVENAIMCALMTHPKVAWCMKITTGVLRLKRGGYLHVGQYFDHTKKKKTGIGDVLGQLRDGRLFNIEVKAPGEEPNDDQDSHINFVIKNNGVAGWADNVADALLIIERA